MLDGNDRHGHVLHTLLHTHHVRVLDSIDGLVLGSLDLNRNLAHWRFHSHGNLAYQAILVSDPVFMDRAIVGFQVVDRAGDGIDGFFPRLHCTLMIPGHPQRGLHPCGALQLGSLFPLDQSRAIDRIEGPGHIPIDTLLKLAITGDLHRFEVVPLAIDEVAQLRLEARIDDFHRGDHFAIGKLLQSLFATDRFDRLLLQLGEKSFSRFVGGGCLLVRRIAVLCGHGCTQCHHQKEKQEQAAFFCKFHFLILIQSRSSVTVSSCRTPSFSIFHHHRICDRGPPGFPRIQ